MPSKRRAEEAAEKQETVKSDAPEAKFQTEQQVAPSTGFKTSAGETNFVLSKKKAPGSQLKQEVAASVIKDATYGGSNSGDGASFAGAKSSGSAGGILGAANATPVAGKARSDSRTGKKLDRNSTKLNYIPNDQVLVEYDESKPLADSADTDQGFNGTYRNEFARSQKKAENVPGALMFDRSVDLISRDQIYFGQGQIVRQEGVRYDEAVTRCAVKNARGQFENYEGAGANYEAGKYGNYMLKDVDFAFDHSGKPLYMHFNELDLDVTVDQHDANKSSAALKIAVNLAELCREVMDSKAGDEKADIWTPLARAVREPTQTVGLLHAIEADVGNEVITAYRKACTSFAYQLNRAHKDGQKTVAPAVEFLTGLNRNYVSSEAAEGEGASLASIFTVEKYVEGAAATIIPLYDSTGKYNTKADVILQPRGPRMHLQTADNNMDPLHVNKLFMQIYDVTETFSTIDREYDPMSPIYMTDKASVIHRISWDKMGSFVFNKFDVKVAGKVDDAEDFVLLPKQGVDMAIARGLTKAHLIYPHEAVGDINAAANNVFQGEPAFESASGDSWQLILSATAPTAPEGYDLVTLTLTAGYDLKFNGKVRIFGLFVNDQASRVFLPKCGPYIYLYHDLRNNYIVQVKHPLLEGLYSYFCDVIGGKYYQLVKNRNVNVVAVHSTKFLSLWSLLLCAATPFITKERINSFRDVLYYEKNVEYPFNDSLAPIADMKTKGYSNFGFINYDTELEVKRMNDATSITWKLPEMFYNCGVVDQTRMVMLPWYSNQNEIKPGVLGVGEWNDDASAMSFPSIRSGVRFAALDSLYGMTEKDVRLSIDRISSWKKLTNSPAYSLAYKYSSMADGQLVLPIVGTEALSPELIMSMPRELGWTMVAPYGTLTPNYNHRRVYDLDTVIGTTSYEATYWLGEDPVACDGESEAILDPEAVNVNRAANFKQVWYTILASGTTPPVDHGFVLSTAQLFDDEGGLIVGRATFHPYANISTDEQAAGEGVAMIPMLSLQKSLWTRIQKLPFVVSPFDLVADPTTELMVDPFDMMYWFGLAGFRASDYRESVYNREKEVINQGIGFVSDPWVEASPLFKEGSGASGISVAKGFQL